ncbi:MAG: potassium channel family protein [Planctomycetes bacterium]|nr:potassium channel family protein [Planctomycetota bacterium]
MEKHRPIAARMLLVTSISALFIFPFAEGSTIYTLGSMACYFFMIMSGVLLAQRKHEAFGMILMGMILMASQLLRGNVFAELPFLTETFGRLVGLAFSVQLAAVPIRHVISDSQYVLDRYFGAATGYLMLGLAFADVYLLISFLAPESFNHAGGGAFNWADAMYFSLVTLTTLGYGDIQPVSSVARMVAALEAVFGVLYLAMLVSMFISEFKANRDRRIAKDTKASDEHR